MGGLTDIGASLTAWALYGLMSRVINYWCNINCPCAFCTPIFHGVSDWMGDNKLTTIVNTLSEFFYLFFFCSFQGWSFTLSIAPQKRWAHLRQVNLDNLVNVDISLHPLIDLRHAPLASGFAKRCENDLSSRFLTASICCRRDWIEENMCSQGHA